MPCHICFKSRTSRIFTGFQILDTAKVCLSRGEPTKLYRHSVRKQTNINITRCRNSGNGKNRRRTDESPLSYRSILWRLLWLLTSSRADKRNITQRFWLSCDPMLKLILHVKRACLSFFAGSNTLWTRRNLTPCMYLKNEAVPLKFRYLKSQNAFYRVHYITQSSAKGKAPPTVISGVCVC